MTHLDLPCNLAWYQVHMGDAKRCSTGRGPGEQGADVPSTSGRERCRARKLAPPPVEDRRREYHCSAVSRQARSSGYMSVSTGPGNTAKVCTPCFPSSARSHCVQSTTPQPCSIGYPPIAGMLARDARLEDAHERALGSPASTGVKAHTPGGAGQRSSCRCPGARPRRRRRVTLNDASTPALLIEAIDVVRRRGGAKRVGGLRDVELERHDPSSCGRPGASGSRGFLRPRRRGRRRVRARLERLPMPRLLPVTSSSSLNFHDFTFPPAPRSWARLGRILELADDC